MTEPTKTNRWQELRSRLLALEPIEPIWRYCLIATPVAMIPDLLLVLIAYGVFVFAGVSPDRLHPTTPPPMNFFGTVVFAPVVETFILAAIISALFYALRRPFVVALVCAIAAGLVHSIERPLGAFGTTFGFFVFSYSYLTWRKLSFTHGYFAAMIPHALNNLFVLSLVKILSR